MKPDSIKNIQSRVGSFTTYEFIAPSHTSEMFNPIEFRKIVRKTVKKVLALRKLHPEIEALAACGQSGLMLMGAVSLLTGLPQIAVRKSLDSDHDSSLANGWFGCKGYLVLDDLVDSGRTLERIAAHVNRSTQERWNSGYSRPKLVAALLYGKSYNCTAQFVVGGASQTVNLYGVNVDGFEMNPVWTFKSSKASKLEREKAEREVQVVLLERPALQQEGAELTFSVEKARQDPAPGRMLSAADVAESFNALMLTSSFIVPSPFSKAALSQPFFCAPDDAPKLPDIELDTQTP